jgi:hypothetical protein
VREASDVHARQFVPRGGSSELILERGDERCKRRRAAEAVIAFCVASSRAWRTADSVMSKVGGDGSSRGGVALGALVGWLDTDTDAVPDLRADSVV